MDKDTTVDFNSMNTRLKCRLSVLIESPVNLSAWLLDCKTKVEYPEGTHVENVQTPCRKALARGWIQTQDLFAVRKPLNHPTDNLLFKITQKSYKRQIQYFAQLQIFYLFCLSWYPEETHLIWLWNWWSVNVLILSLWKLVTMYKML